jgi:hypothetical protein
MPSIPRGLLDISVYLYPSRESAEKGERFGGCGFLVGYPTQFSPSAQYVYAVANYHVAIAGGCPVVRVNTMDGGVDILEFDVSDWTCIPRKGGDLAAVLVTMSPNHDAAQIDVRTGITQAESKDNFFGPGDDVFMIGRFIDHDGGQTNMPAVRFGNISTRPAPLQGTSNSDGSVEYFCLDMHSRSGFSGAAVFCYRTTGSNIEDAFTGTTTYSPTVLRLLGIHCGQFPEEMELVEQDGTKRSITGYSGMTYVLPAWKIVELLNTAEFSRLRGITESQQKNLRLMEDAASPQQKRF